MAKDNKGKSFELEVQQILTEYLKARKLGLSPKTAIVKQGQSYKSKQRKETIITDVSIEVTLPGRTEPYLLWIWECKDYEGPVPVGKIQEFKAKLEEIGTGKTKGALVARNEFQEGCLSYAKSEGIMLVRILPPGTLHVICDSTYEDAITAQRGLIEKDAVLLGPIIFGMTSTGQFTTHLYELIDLKRENMLE